MDPDLRRRARKARRAGVVMRKSSTVELAPKLFDLLGETWKIRQSKGYGNYEAIYFPFFNILQINKLLESGNAVFYYAEHDGKIIGITLNYKWNGRMYGMLMGTGKLGYNYDATSFLLSEIVNDLKQLNYRYLNVGGVQRDPKHGGLKKFKDNLGAVEIRSAEAVTDFINPPLIYLNPLLQLKQFLKAFPHGWWPAKKFVIRQLDLIIKQRDWP